MAGTFGLVHIFIAILLMCTLLTSCTVQAWTPFSFLFLSPLSGAGPSGYYEQEIKMCPQSKGQIFMVCLQLLELF